MTPVGKALNIVVVGLGQAGGNLAAEFSRLGYSALALNTAASDLSSLEAQQATIAEGERLNISMQGHDGAGADPAYGRTCILGHADLLRERVGKLAAKADLLLFTAGLGGGTGSAVPELLAALDAIPANRAVLATLPNRHESSIVKVNALRAVDQLLRTPLDARIIIDNARLSLTHGETPLDRYYAEINRRICEPLAAFNALNDRSDYTPISVLDGEDLRTLLLNGGFTNLATAPLLDLRADTLLTTVRNTVQQGALLLQSHVLEQLSYLGLVVEAPAERLSALSFGDYEHICEQLKHETAGAAVQLALYSGPATCPTVVRVLCASHCPPDGIHAMVEQTKQEASLLQEKLRRPPVGLDLGELSDMDLFGVAQRRPYRPHPSGGSPGQERPRGKRHSMVRSAKRGGHEDEQASADRDAYDRLVQEYEATDDAHIRQQVAERLQADRASPDSLTRYYAVRAMAKLSPHDFNAALLAATHDEDATVRAVASEALRR